MPVFSSLHAGTPKTRLLSVLKLAIPLGLAWRSYVFLRSFLRSAYMRALWNRICQLLRAYCVTRMNPGVRRSIQGALARINTSVPPSHSHADAAAERNGATESMIACVNAMGMKPYVISPSPRESGLDGARYYYSLADLNQEIRENPITSSHCIVMTDVDYYVDMPSILALGRPVLAYTFQPQRVAGEIANGFFTITDNEVCYRVSGGKTVSHRIWNYNQDVVYTRSPAVTFSQACYDALAKACWWFTPRGIASHIDQFQLSDHRRIVAITPFAHLNERLYKELYGKELARCDYTQTHEGKKYNLLVSLEKDGPVVSLSQPGELAEACIPLGDFQAIVIAHHEASAKHLSDTVRRSKLDPNKAAVLHTFLNTGLTPAVEVHQPGKLARHFVCSSMDKKTVFDVPQEYAREFAKAPLDLAAVFPSECEDNDKAGIEGRVTKPQADSKAMQNILPRFYKYAAQFVEHVVPNSHQGRPCSIDEVNEKQDRPTQRTRTKQRDMDVEESFVVKAFQKREAYNGPNHPRNISTVPTTHTLRLSSFTYQFKKDCLYGKKWYMPGRTPQQIADAVMELAQRCEELVETDFSRFDGHINHWLRTQVVFPCYLRWVHPDDRDELHRLLIAELDPKARNKSGKYQAGCSRLSGSPLTTDGNTIVDVFSEYASLREEGYTHLEALDLLGISYSDDAVRDGKVSDKKMVTTAKLLGLKLKIEKRAAKGESITFLSRVFKDPWNSPASIQSPRRALLKLHTTVNRVAPIEEMGIAKVSGYLVTDSLTPFIANWCKCYLRCVRAQQIADCTKCEDAPYWAREATSAAAPWPQLGEDFTQIIAEDLGVSAAVLLEHIKKLDTYTGDVMAIPQLQTGLVIEPKCDVILDGEHHSAEPTNDPPTEKDKTKGQVSTEDGAKERVPQLPLGSLDKPTKHRDSPRDHVCLAVKGGPHQSSTNKGRPAVPSAHNTNRRNPKADGKLSEQPPQRRGTSRPDWNRDGNKRRGTSQRPDATRLCKQKTEKPV